MDFVAVVCPQGSGSIHYMETFADFKYHKRHSVVKWSLFCVWKIVIRRIITVAAEAYKTMLFRYRFFS